jgi:hypothetical protein
VIRYRAAPAHSNIYISYQHNNKGYKNTSSSSNNNNNKQQQQQTTTASNNNVTAVYMHLYPNT